MLTFKQYLEEVAKKRDYKYEYKRDHSKPHQLKRRAQRMRDRYWAIKKGRLGESDPRELHHVAPKGSKGSLGTKTRVMSREQNRKIGHPE
jgi:hypothetical protein